MRVFSVLACLLFSLTFLPGAAWTPPDANAARVFAPDGSSYVIETRFPAKPDSDRGKSAGSDRENAKDKAPNSKSEKNSKPASNSKAAEKITQIPSWLPAAPAPVKPASSSNSRLTAPGKPARAPGPPMFRETIGLRGEIVNPASGETGRDISPTAPELVHARLAYTGSDKSGDSYVVWTLDGPTGEDYPGAVRLTQAEDPQKEGIEDIGQMSEDVDGASSADSEEPQNTVRFLLGIAGKVFDWLRQNSLTNGHGNQELEPMSMPTPENPNYPPFPTPEPTPTPAPVPWLPTPTPTPAPAPWQPTPTPTPAPVPWQPTPTPTPAPVPWQPTPTPTPAPAPFLPTPAPPPPFLPAPAPEPTPDPEPLPPTYTGPSTALRLQGNIDENGIVLRTLQGSFLEGHLWIRVEPGTKALDRRGNPLEWINVERVDELPPLPDGWRAAIAFELTPDGALFSPGVLLNLSYDYIALSRAAEKGDLHLVYYNPHTGQWVKLNQSINLSMSAVETQLDHFTLLALFEKTPSGMPVSWWLIGGILAASLIVGAIIMSVVRMKVEEEPEEYAGEGPG